MSCHITHHYHPPSSTADQFGGDRKPDPYLPFPQPCHPQSSLLTSHHPFPHATTGRAVPGMSCHIPPNPPPSPSNHIQSYPPSPPFTLLSRACCAWHVMSTSPFYPSPIFSLHTTLSSPSSHQIPCNNRASCAWPCTWPAPPSFPSTACSPRRWVRVVLGMDWA